MITEIKSSVPAFWVRASPTPQFLGWHHSHGDLSAWTASCLSFFLFSTMQYLGGKLSAAQLHVTSWMGSMRHSLQGALDLMWGASREKKEEEEEEEGGRDRGGGGRFQRAMTPLRSFARRSRRSLRRFSVRSRPTLQRRTTEAYSVRTDKVTLYYQVKFHEISWKNNEPLHH